MHSVYVKHDFVEEELQIVNGCINLKNNRTRAIIQNPGRPVYPRLSESMVQVWTRST